MYMLKPQTTAGCRRGSYTLNPPPIRKSIEGKECITIQTHYGAQTHRVAS